ncbi:MAG: hypothetical protein DRP12_02805 [Candidatus Aenigmatarchaeota archaeon]|nr:MAG: hypothetical protein DRP12_02805 [Candidatus Aenigmarchaeota archaeon]
MKKAVDIAKAILVLIIGGISCYYFYLFLGPFGLLCFFSGISLLLLGLGNYWELTLKRPALSGKPLVSIIIPAYRSETYIADTIKSAKRIRWPEKEILVVNDSQDRTPKICEELGVRCIQNRERLGKAKALNLAAKHAKGDILLFVDSDTVLEPDCLEKTVPWFSKPDVGAVALKFVVKNKNHSILTRLSALEANLHNNLFKAEMLFGSLISFRGCGVAIRKSAFDSVGGWPEHLLEDAAMGAELRKAGYRIIYEPEAIARTAEPENLKLFIRQRIRWGKGAFLAFLRSVGFYLKSPQFALQFLPLIFSFFTLTGLFLWQIFWLAPILFLWFTTLSIKEVLLLFSFFLLPHIYNFIFSLFPALTSHTAILSLSEGKKEVLFLLPYLFIFLPFTNFIYLKGILQGIRDRKKEGIDFSVW